MLGSKSHGQKLFEGDFVIRTVRLREVEHEVESELCEKLPAGSTRADEVLVNFAGDSDGCEAPMSLCDRFDCSRSFSTQTDRVGCVFDVASCRSHSVREWAVRSSSLTMIVSPVKIDPSSQRRAAPTGKEL